MFNFSAYTCMYSNNPLGTWEDVVYMYMMEMCSSAKQPKETEADYANMYMLYMCI